MCSWVLSGDAGKWPAQAALLVDDVGGMHGAWLALLLKNCSQHIVAGTMPLATVFEQMPCNAALVLLAVSGSADKNLLPSEHAKVDRSVLKEPLVSVAAGGGGVWINGHWMC